MTQVGRTPPLHTVGVQQTFLTIVHCITPIGVRNQLAPWEVLHETASVILAHFVGLEHGHTCAQQGHASARFELAPFVPENEAGTAAVVCSIVPLESFGCGGRILYLFRRDFRNQRDKVL